MTMLHSHVPENYHRLMSRLSSLPKKILSLHGNDHVTHLVMHELCNESLLNLNRAAYLVDNQDFNCLQGVAGFCKKEAYNGSCDIWNNQQEFLDALNHSDFNNQVKNFNQGCLKKKSAPEEERVQEIARSLNIENPGYYSWDMKHDNHGIFIFQKNDVPSAMLEYLSDTVCLLGFCPIV